MTSIIIAIIIVAILLIFIASSHARITKLTEELDALHDRIAKFTEELDLLHNKLGKVVDNGMGPGKKVSGQ